jgi:hypothetical protein
MRQTRMVTIAQQPRADEIDDEAKYRDAMASL